MGLTALHSIQLWLKTWPLSIVNNQFKNKKMKNYLKAIRFILATLLIVIASQATVLAESTDTTASSGLSAGQIIGGFVVLLLVVLVPLVRSKNHSITQK